MNYDARHWLSAWALAVAFVAAIALAGHPRLHRDDVRGYDVARTRTLFAPPTNPRLAVEHDEPLAEPGSSEAGADPMAPKDAPPAHPIC